MPAILKADLIQLLERAQVQFDRKSTKGELEGLLRDALRVNPGAVALDSRLKRFAPKQEKPDPVGDDSTPESVAEAPADAVDEVVETITDTAANVAEDAQDIIVDVGKEAQSLAVSLSDTTVSLARAHLAQVSGVNTLLAIVELINFLVLEVQLTLKAARWGVNNDWWGIISVTTQRAAPGVGLWLLTLLLPLLVAFLANFSKMPSIRRKKHEFKVDPEVYGLGRVVTALVLRNTPSFKSHYPLSVASGAASSLLALYAALLQTK